MTKSKKLSIALMLLILAAGIILFITFSKTTNIASVIGIDVNPSIEINLDKNDKVISVNTLNADGEKVLGEMDLSGTNLDVAINALVGSLMQNGYLTNETNSVLINVESESDEKEDLLNKTVSTNIQNAISAQGIQAAVINSDLDDSNKAKAEEIAQNNDISTGKAALINTLLNLNSNYTQEELSALNITQLTLLLDESDDINVEGVVSSSAYISAEKAFEIAKAHAKVTTTTENEYDFDFENGKFIYEIEFKADFIEYEYDIDAVTGEVLLSKKENDDNSNNTQENNAASSLITAEKALEIATIHAGVSQYTLEKNKLDSDDDIIHYEIEFKSGTTEYEYDINATNGSIISFEKDLEDNNDLYDDFDDLHDDDKDDAPFVGTGFISEANAIEIAKNHAGVTDVYELKAEFDNDDGISLYEVEFKSSNTEYEYDIDAASGAIITFEHDIDD